MAICTLPGSHTPINSKPDNNTPPPQLAPVQPRTAPAAPTAPTAVTGCRRLAVRVRFLFKNLRHRSREYLGWLLARLVGRPHYATSLAPGEISTVLICRINGRIGNTLFLTPLIRYL